MEDSHIRFRPHAWSSLKISDAEQGWSEEIRSSLLIDKIDCQIREDLRRLRRQLREHPRLSTDYNRYKDRVTIEETFSKLVDLVKGLGAESRRAAEGKD